MAFCTTCGTNIGEDKAFCTKCGAAMGGRTPVFSDMNSAGSLGEQPAAALSAAGGSDAGKLSLWGYFVKCLKKFISFDGRARRREFWGFYMFSVIFAWALCIICLAAAAPSLIEHLREAILNDAFADNTWEMAFQLKVTRALMPVNFFWLALLLPLMAVTSRRLHDIGKSGLWILYFLLIYMGGIILGMIPIGIGTGLEGAGRIAAILAGGVVVLGTVVGIIVWVLVWLCRDSQPGANKYGAYTK